MEMDFLPIKHLDYVEFYVGNAKQTAYFFMSAMGFSPVAYSGLETGIRDRVSYVLEQGDIRLVISGALQKDHPIAEFVKEHGDGVRDLAMCVASVEEAFKAAVDRGAVPVLQPVTLEDEFGVYRKAAIRTYGDTIHTFVEKEAYQGPFAPGYTDYSVEFAIEPSGLVAVDHTVGNVELGKMEEWVSFYENVLGFSQFISFDDKDISTDYSALMSKVMANGTGRIKFPINEPAAGKKKSQIQEYLDFYNGPGVQHIALLTRDIVSTVKALKARGVEFLTAPDSYYEELGDRVGDIDEELDELKGLNILVDRDDEGYLLQIFSKPVVDRPTLFFEIIQRKGAKGFGKGNFKALFESIEREQAKRGNL